MLEMSSNDTYVTPLIENATEKRDEDSRPPSPSPHDIYVSENLLFLQRKSEEKVLEHFRKRYENKTLYTWVGNILVLLNPYEESFPIVHKTDGVLPMVNTVWHRLQGGGKTRNQAIVISGDSGSGKTYTASLILSALVSKQRSEIGTDDLEVLTKILASAPILRAFGNAPTIHNDNSSRFGKMLRIQYNDGKIVGAFIQTFLLEKSRVSDLNPGEGNFHIFRQILENNDAVRLQKLFLYDLEYKIAPAARKPTEDITNALYDLEITFYNCIQSVLSAILSLGNVEFELIGDTSTISAGTFPFAINAASVLKVHVSEIEDLLTTRVISTKRSTRRSCYTVPCYNVEDCEERRKCLMRFLYEMLFAWLVEQINCKIYVRGNFPTIGVLDIYGFEVFPHNTFEQLCINYANERLHYYFIQDNIVKQLEQLSADGMEVSPFDDEEYARRLEMFSGIPSIFSILNEESLLKRHHTNAFVNVRLSENLCHYPHLIASHANFATTFSIKHYAGRVKYDVKTMVTKNRDKIPDEMTAFLHRCNMPYLQDILFASQAPQKEKTLISKFKKSLDDLVRTLDEGDVSYVKCLKPNSRQLPNAFEEGYFLQQVRSNGVMDVLSHLQKHPIRMIWSDFRRHFSSALLEFLTEANCKDFYFGNDCVYVTEMLYRRFWRLELLKRHLAAVKIQTLFRKVMWKRHESAAKIQRCWRRFVAKKLAATLISSGRPNVRLCVHVLQERKWKLHHCRPVFKGMGVATHFRIPQVPVRFHLAKTCIPYSHLPPVSELPKGLPDVFL